MFKEIVRVLNILINFGEINRERREYIRTALERNCNYLLTIMFGYGLRNYVAA